MESLRTAEKSKVWVMFNFLSFPLSNIVYVWLKVIPLMKSEQITWALPSPPPHLWPCINRLNMSEIMGSIVVEVYFRGRACFKGAPHICMLLSPLIIEELWTESSYLWWPKSLKVSRLELQIPLRKDKLSAYFCQCSCILLLEKLIWTSDQVEN